MTRLLHWLAVVVFMAGLFGLCLAVPAAVADDEIAATTAVEQEATSVPAGEKKTSEQPAATKAAPEEKTPAAVEEEEPEIEIEVIGKKWGEEAVPSILPVAGEVTSVVNAKEIEATGAKTVIEALEFLPSVQVLRQGRKFEKMINIRGASAATILIDGAQVSAATTQYRSGFTARILYTLPLAAVERIEVIRNSSNLIYGPQALNGGVINIVTRRGKGPAHIENYATVGSFEYARYGLGGFEGNAARGTVFIMENDRSDSNLEFGHHNLANFFFRSDRTWANGDTFKFTWLYDNGVRNLDVWDKPFQKVTGNKPTYWTFDPWQESYLSLTYAHNLRKPGSGIDAVTWFRNRFYRNLYFDGPIQPKTDDIVYQDSKDGTIGGMLFWRQPFGSHYARSGFQYFRVNAYDQDFTLNSLKQIVPKPVTPGDTELTSYFAQDEWTINPNTKFFYGGRWERPRDRNSAFVYAFALERGLHRDISVYARFGTGVSVPTYKQLVTNSTLKDSTSKNWDVGMDAPLGPNMVWHLGWFSSAVENDFITYLKPGGDATKPNNYLTAQADQTTSGWEAELQGRLRGSLRWFANWTLTDRMVNRTPVIGDQPLQLSIPARNIGSIGLRWSPDRSRTSLMYSHHYTSDYKITSGYLRGAWDMPSFQVANLTIDQNVGRGWSLKASIDNLFNETYSVLPGFPMPGRNYTFGFYHTSNIK